MDFDQWMKRERLLWHNHFIPSVFAGLIVAFLAYLYELTLPNIVMFASVGASVTILTHTHSHHLTRLYTAILAYFIASLLSALVYILKSYVETAIYVDIFLVIFLVNLGLFLFNVFHPPAVGASLAFILFHQRIADLAYLFIAIVIALIVVRFFTYIFSQHLSVTEFVKEFEKEL